MVTPGVIREKDGQAFPGEELGQQKQQLAVVTFFSSWRQL